MCRGYVEIALHQSNEGTREVVMNIRNSTLESVSADSSLWLANFISSLASLVFVSPFSSYGSCHRPVSQRCAAGSPSDMSPPTRPASEADIQGYLERTHHPLADNVAALKSDVAQEPMRVLKELMVGHNIYIPFENTFM